MSELAAEAGPATPSADSLWHACDTTLLLSHLRRGRPERPLDRFDSWVLARASQLFQESFRNNGVLDPAGDGCQGEGSASRTGAVDDLRQELLAEWARCLRLESFKYRAARTQAARLCAESGSRRAEALQASCTTGQVLVVPLSIVLHSENGERRLAGNRPLPVPELCFLVRSNADAELWGLDFVRKHIDAELHEHQTRGFRAVRLRCAMGGTWHAVCDASDLGAYLSYCTDRGLQLELSADCVDGQWPAAAALSPTFGAGGLPRARDTREPEQSDAKRRRQFETPPSGPSRRDIPGQLDGAGADSGSSDDIFSEDSAAGGAAGPGSSVSRGRPAEDDQSSNASLGSSDLSEGAAVGGVLGPPTVFGEGSDGLGTRFWAVVSGCVEKVPQRLRGTDGISVPWSDVRGVPSSTTWELRDVWMQVRHCPPATSRRTAGRGRPALLFEAEVPHLQFHCPPPAWLTKTGRDV